MRGLSVNHTILEIHSLLHHIKTHFKLLQKTEVFLEVHSLQTFDRLLLQKTVEFPSTLTDKNPSKIEQMNLPWFKTEEFLFSRSEKPNVPL